MQSRFQILDHAEAEYCNFSVINDWKCWSTFHSSLFGEIFFRELRTTQRDNKMLLFIWFWKCRTHSIFFFCYVSASLFYLRMPPSSELDHPHPPKTTFRKNRHWSMASGDDINVKYRNFMYRRFPEGRIVVTFLRKRKLRLVIDWPILESRKKHFSEKHINGVKTWSFSLYDNLNKIKHGAILKHDFLRFIENLLI